MHIIACMAYDKAVDEIAEKTLMLDSTRNVEALVKTKAVLNALVERGPCNIKTISEYVNEPPSSTYRLLSNLVALGWVDKSVKRGEYRLGLKCIRIGGQIESRLDIQNIARRCFKEQRGLGTWSLFVRRQLRSVCVEMMSDLQNLLRSPEIGYSLPISMGAPSNVLLAFLSESRLADVIEHYRYNADMGGLLATFRQKSIKMSAAVRQRGYSYDVDETVPGVLTISAPVFDHHGDLCAAICLSGFQRSRVALLDRGDEFVELDDLLEVCRQVSQGLGNVPTGESHEGGIHD